MDDRRGDGLGRVLAAGASRRVVLKALGGGIGGGLLGLHAVSPAAAAPPTGPIQAAGYWGRNQVTWEQITRWDRQSRDACAEFGAPLLRVRAHIAMESGGDRWRVQRNPENGDSYGLLQVVPRWWGDLIRELSGSDAQGEAELGQLLLDRPRLAVRCGVAVLRYYFDEYGSWAKASSGFFTGTPNWNGQDTVNGTTGAAYRDVLNRLIDEQRAT